jgi:hypothetical protein
VKEFAMKMTRLSFAAALAGCVLVIGCQSGSNSARTTRDNQSPPSRQRRQEQKHVYTASDNPTTTAGRGAPSLEDQFRPAAWILVDGQEGHYLDVEGHPHLEWVIDHPVSSTPTFRVEAFPQLLGDPDGFKAVLQSIQTQDGSSLVYGIAADTTKDAHGHVATAFSTGKTFNMLDPGPNFTIRNLMTGDVVQKIGELPPGKYAFAGGVRNTKTGAETPAVTFFTVGK